MSALLMGCTACTNEFWREYYARTESIAPYRTQTESTPELKSYRVRRVVDGATLEVWNKGRLEIVRITGVVTGPTDTVWGKSAKDALRYLEGKSVTIDACPKKDRQGRTVGEVYYKEESVAEIQLKKGQVRPDRSARPCSPNNLKRGC